MREELRLVLRNYDLPLTESVKQQSHSPDMLSYAFSVQGKDYVLVEVEWVGSDLQEEEYKRLSEDLGLDKKALKLILPRLEQMYTTTNQAGLGIDGHQKIIDLYEVEELDQDEQLPGEYKNPNLIDSDTTFVLFEVVK